MNIMMLQRYQKELILLLALLFAIFAFMYKLSATTYVSKSHVEIQDQITQINSLVALKDQWANKQLANKVNVLKTVVDSSKVATFNKKSKKLIAFYTNLTGNELSSVTNKLINIPVQIVLLKITKVANNQYTMEFTCKW